MLTKVVFKLHKVADKNGEGIFIHKLICCLFLLPLHE